MYLAVPSTSWGNGERRGARAGGHGATENDSAIRLAPRGLAAVQDSVQRDMPYSESDRRKHLCSGSSVDFRTRRQPEVGGLENTGQFLKGRG